MFNKHVKRILILIGEHLMFAAVSLLFLSLFPWALDGGIAAIIYSIVLGTLYLFAVYESFWRNGSKDYRQYTNLKNKEPNSNIKFKNYSGFVDGSFIFALNIILLILACSGGDAWNSLYRIFNFVFFGFIAKDENIISVKGSLFVSILPTIVAGVGYMVGKRNVSIFEKYFSKLIYKKK